MNTNTLKIDRHEIVAAHFEAIAQALREGLNIAELATFHAAAVEQVYRHYRGPASLFSVPLAGKLAQIAAASAGAAPVPDASGRYRDPLA
jgi:hypothetical protein